MAIEWSEKYETGVAKIDNQHQELVYRIGSYMKACNEGRSKSEIKDMFDFLETYVIQHFNDEEEIQLKIRYPKYQEHLDAHKELKQQVKKIKSDIENEHISIISIISANKTLVKWIFNHIGRLDQEIAQYIKDNKISV